MPVAPEGTLEEVRVMAQLAIDAARLNPAQTFMRLHPVINHLISIAWS